MCFFIAIPFYLMEESIKHEVQQTAFYWINIVQMMAYSVESLASDTS